MKPIDLCGGLPKIDDVVARLERSLPRGLFLHCRRVNGVALELGPRFGCDRGQADLAAWVHDVCRAEKGNRLLALAHDFGIPVSDLERRFPILLHGPVGAEVLRRNWGVADAAVLDAVRYHTTGRGGMGLLERVLFLSDKIEPGKDRAYTFNPTVRRTLEAQGLDRALLEWLNAQLAAFLSGGDCVHPLMVEARNGLLLERGAVQGAE